jgi:hypothetical protein
VICESEKRQERKTDIVFKRSAGVEYRENRVCIFGWSAYSSASNICHTE